ncbi:MAG: 4-alpha-glucanotransferase [Polyangiales bacterium]
MATARDSDAISLPTLHARGSGVLLHLTSLPGPHGSGDLGEEARQFVDFLARAEQSYWQLLPVGPTGYGNSPYSAQSAFAGNPLLIALSPLVTAGWLSADALAAVPGGDPERVDFGAVEQFRGACLRRAYEAAKDDPDFARYREREKSWLADYALFRALKRAHGEVEWTRWDPAVRDRQTSAIERATSELSEEIAYRSFEQWLFDRQWHALREYAHSRGIALIGDLPIFLAHDSADVWQHRELFQLDETGLPRVVSGVPPDYFSTTGQRWGNPLYDWRRMHAQHYAFWVDRMRSELSRFDVVRLDHFIGFERYWEIPAAEATAVNGRWVQGPSDAIFSAFKHAFGPGQLSAIAEDLGEVTPEVKALRDRWGLPGIRILQFAFGTDPSASDFLPHHYPRNAVVYTGTHDNDTTVGWFFAEDPGSSSRDAAQVAREQQTTLEYLGKSDTHDIHWDMIRACMSSVANTAIFPLQDLLGLGSGARMNRPGAHAGNWEWRTRADALTDTLASRLAGLTRTYGRLTRPASHEAKQT